MGFRRASAPYWRYGLGAALLAAGMALPARADGIAAGFACGLTSAPVTGTVSLQHVAAQRRGTPRRGSPRPTYEAARVPMLHAFFTCPAEPVQQLGAGWRTSGPRRPT